MTDWNSLPLLDDSFPLPLDAPFTRAQALAAGLTPYRLGLLLADGLLTHPIKGVYAAAQVEDSITFRAACLRLVTPEDAVICDRHAGWLHGAEMVLRPGEHLHRAGITMYLPAGRGRLRNVLTDGGERTFRPDDLVERDGLRLTSPIRTAWDLGRQRWPEPAIAAMDALLRLDAFTHEELIAGIERFRGARWVTTLRQWAPFADGRSQSPGESVLRLRCWEAGLPTMTPQYEVSHAGKVAYLDLGEPVVCFATEYDGAEWHSTPEQVAHDEKRRAWVRDDLGWTVRAVGIEETFGRDRAVDRILREAYAEARRRTHRAA